MPTDATLDRALEILIGNVGVARQNAGQLDALIGDVNAMAGVK